MDISLVSLDLRYDLLLLLALVLAAESASLIYVASLSARPWRERALALVPAVAFAWVLLAARGVHATDDYWQHYLAFQTAHYDAHYYPGFSAQDQADLASTIVSVNRTDWIAIGVTLVCLALGGLLLARWSGRRWPIHRRRVESAAARLSDNELEMTVEPLERPRDER